MKHPNEVIVRALVTEKGTKLREGGNKYLFQVSREANKLEIQKAVEQLFSVTVERVRTQNQIGKPKRLGRFFGRRPGWKKAIVTLKAGDVIELFEEV
jgi:large subunit ribosomal protein L23